MSLLHCISSIGKSASCESFFLSPRKDSSIPSRYQSDKKTQDLWKDFECHFAEPSDIHERKTDKKKYKKSKKLDHNKNLIPPIKIPKRVKHRPPTPRKLSTSSSSPEEGSRNFHLPKIVEEQSLPQLIKPYLEQMDQALEALKQKIQTRGLLTPKNMNELVIDYSRLVDVFNTGIKMLNEENDMSLPCSGKKALECFLNETKISETKLWCKKLWGDKKSTQFLKSLKSISARRQLIKPILRHIYQIKETEDAKDRISQCSLQCIHETVSRNIEPKLTNKACFKSIKVGFITALGNKIPQHIIFPESLKTSAWYREIFTAIDNSGYKLKNVDLELRLFFKLKNINTDIEKIRKKIRCFSILQCLSNQSTLVPFEVLTKICPLILKSKDVNDNNSEEYAYNLNFRELTDAHAEIWIKKGQKSQVIQHRSNMFVLNITSKESSINIEIAKIKWAVEIECAEDDFKVSNLKIDDLFIFPQNLEFSSHLNVIEDYQMMIDKYFRSSLPGEHRIAGRIITPREELPSKLDFPKILA